MTATVVPPPGANPIAAFTPTEALVATSESTTSASFTDLATVGPAVTITVPASGKVLVTLTCQNNQGSGNSDGAQMSFAMSGANTAAANTDQMFYFASSGHTTNLANGYSVSYLLTGLNPGSTTFTAKYASPAGNTQTFLNRRLSVEPVDADNAPGGTAAFPSTEAEVTTAQSTSSNSFGDLGTVGPSVTITVPASGKVKVSVTCTMGISFSFAEGQMSFALSGANTVAASASNMISFEPGTNSVAFRCTGTFLLTGLTPGSTTFTAKYSSSTGNSSTFSNRRLRVSPVDADNG